MKVKTTRRAANRIAVVDRFWRRQRRDAPDLFKSEPAAAEERLGREPTAGRWYSIRGKEYRRLLLPKTKQWLYYQVREGQGVIVVQAVWGAQRGRDPKL